MVLCAMLPMMTACGAEMYEENTVGIHTVQGDNKMYAEYAEGAVVDQESYAAVKENTFRKSADYPLSTFSADVDTASYANVRRMIRSGETVNPDAVRIEEMVNYFSYDYPEPTDGAPLSVTTEMYDCPWNPENQLFLIGMQAEKIDMSDRKPMNLVFLIDVSGSMETPDKLPLVQSALTMLSEELNENDRISIVTYAGMDTVVLKGVSGNNLTAINNAVYGLTAGGSTAGEMGIRRAYEIAEEYFIHDGNNRVLLCTDGDLNVGMSTPEELKELVEWERKTGVYLSVLGFGTGNLRDDSLEALADNGNGNYAYIDSKLEARKVLVQEMGGTMYTVAKDVKLQTEFDPDMVESYRLIGYENRLLADEDFEDDSVDAGDIGSGHTVTALYELVLTDAAKDRTDPMLTVSMRYKEPESEQSELREYPISYADCRTETIGKNLAFAAAVTEFGMLTGEREAYGASYDQIQELLAQTDLQDAFRQEFKELTAYVK